MRRFFRFSIRDLLWLTLVVAVALGWFVRERHAQAEAARMQAEVDRSNNRATKWRQSAGALEFVLTREGRKVRWDMESMWVHVSTSDGSFNVGISQFTQPSAADD